MNSIVMAVKMIITMSTQDHMNITLTTGTRPKEEKKASGGPLIKIVGNT